MRNAEFGLDVDEKRREHSPRHDAARQNARENEDRSSPDSRGVLLVYRHRDASYTGFGTEERTTRTGYLGAAVGLVPTVVEISFDTSMRMEDTT